MGILLEQLPVPGDLELDHFSRGGRDLKRYVARIAKGKVLRVMAGREPFTDSGAIKWHISLSVANSPSADEPPSGRVSRGHIAAAKSLFPGRWKWEQERQNRVVHLWQK